MEVYKLYGFSSGEPLITKEDYAEEVLRTYVGQDTWKNKYLLFH